MQGDRKEPKCILYYQMKQDSLKKVIICMIPTISHSGKGKTIGTVKDQWLPGVGKEGGRDE